MKEIAGIKVYTVKETAELLQVTAQTVRKYVKAKKLIGQRIGRPYYISEQSIQNFLTGGLINEYSKHNKQSKQ